MTPEGAGETPEKSRRKHLLRRCFCSARTAPAEAGEADAALERRGRKDGREWDKNFFLDFNRLIAVIFDDFPLQNRDFLIYYRHPCKGGMIWRRSGIDP